MNTLLKNLRESQNLMKYTPIILLAILGLGFHIATQGKFGNSRNLMLIFNQTIIIATVASGAVFIFGTSNISIAIGATTSLVATLATLVFLKTDSLGIMLLVAIASGVVVMLLTALLSLWLKVTVMFVSIVMMILMMAIVQTILGASTLSIPYAVTSVLTQSNFQYIAFIIYFLVCAVIFHFTSIGRAIRFIGSNRFCAEQTGLYMTKYLLIAFAITGVGAGLSAVMIAIRTGSISFSTASNLNMDVVLAIVLGGMSVFGGTRSFIYAGVLGALTVSMLNNGLLMVGISPTILQLVRGVFFLTLIVMGQKRPVRLPEKEI